MCQPYISTWEIRDYAQLIGTKKEKKNNFFFFKKRSSWDYVCCLWRNYSYTKIVLVSKHGGEEKLASKACWIKRDFLTPWHQLPGVHLSLPLARENAWWWDNQGRDGNSWPKVTFQCKVSQLKGKTSRSQQRRSRGFWAALATSPELVVAMV